jgi:P27 family predicted phage terminase small subunit
MGKRGPAPTPTKLLKMRGTFRPDRHEADVLVPTIAKIPRPPARLSKGARREWRRIADNLFELGILTPLDLGALEAYSIARDRALEAELELARDGRTIKTPQGLRRHPACVTAEKAWADCRRYEMLFGLTPSARRSLRMSEKDPIDEANAARNERFFRARKRPG